MNVECIRTVIYVREMARAVKFYRDVIGLTVISQSEHWSEVGRGDAVIGLHSGGDEQVRETGLSFQVSDLEAACQEAVDGAATLVQPPVSRPNEPIRLAEIVDPEGNRVALVQFVG